MKKFKRIFVIVMDSLGVGAEPDASEYGDAGTDTWGHIGENYQLTMPTLQKMGIANLHHIKGVEPVENPIGYVGKLQEASKGKDTLTGHWEIMGLKVTDPFIAFTDTGFPQELLDRLEKETGHGWLGNYSASGTEIIKELGEEHLRTGKMIVYTSADSVLQIACHEEAFGLQELYRCCEIAREICMKPEWKVGRIIARPFVGDNASNFTRDSAARHDLAVAPFAPTVMNTMQDAGLDVIGVGKIFDIFSGQGVTETHKGGSNKEHMEMTIELAKKDFTGLCFVNLVDFDALFGHRRDPIGYGKAIDEFDKQLAELLDVVRDDDLIICTADHGNDPTWVGTDHTREMIPVIAYSKSFTSAGQLDLGYTFANIGATVADNFEVKMPENGESFLDKLV